MQVNWMVYEQYAQVSWVGNALEDEEGRAFHLVVWGALGTQNSAGDEVYESSNKSFGNLIIKIGVK